MKNAYAFHLFRFISRLDEVDDLFLAKREIGSSHNLFGEFVGTKLIRYNIVNLNKF